MLVFFTSILSCSQSNVSVSFWVITDRRHLPQGLFTPRGAPELMVSPTPMTVPTIRAVVVVAPTPIQVMMAMVVTATKYYIRSLLIIYRIVLLTASRV